MANLNDWQKISRLIEGKPFGDGSDGSLSSATIPTITKDSCSGTDTSSTLTTTGSTFANGDVLFIRQARGTGVGQWEVNRVVDGGGTTSLTLMFPLHYTFTDSGASQSQVTKIALYHDVTVESGTWTLPAWDGNVGGDFAIAAKESITITGTISGSGKGFVGGAAVGPGQVQTSKQGEGESAAGGSLSSTNNGAGGGGSSWSDDGVPAAGGGYKTGGSSTTWSTGAASWGSSDDLTTGAGFGGSGGGGNTGNTGDTTSGKGGNGGGFVIIFAKNIIVSGGISDNGENGANKSGGGEAGAGGGGAGGGVLLICQSATLDTNKITAAAGAGGTGSNGSGGAGSVGKIAVHHQGTVTGTTSPTFTDVTDPTLFETVTGISFAYFM